MQTLILNGNQLTALPSFSNLTALLELNLNDNQLITLPDAISNLRNLRNLYLDQNHLTTLPETIGNLTNLRNLYLSDNQLTTLPETIGNLTNLINLYLSDNQLTTLPGSIGNLSNLSNLNLRNNPIHNLPAEIHNIRNLVITGLSPHISIPNLTQPIIAPSLNLIESLCISANFSNEEKTQPYESFFSLENLTQESEESQALTARLGAMLEFFHSSSNQDSQYGSAQGSPAHNPHNQTPNLILAINRFISQSASWNFSNQEQKKHLARYLLKILSQVYEKKDEKDFIEQVEIVSRDSLVNCADRNSLFIFNLANFCQRRNSEDLNLMHETQSAQLFNYFKNQLLYNYFLALGQEKVNQIKIENPIFSEDVEVLLNYLRIYNNQFSTSLNLQLPNISNQRYFDEIAYQPSPEQIANFKIIADRFLNGDLLALQDKLAEIFVNDLDMLPISNPEILEIGFVQKHIKQIENIAQEFLSLFEEHKQQREGTDQEMTDGEYTAKMNKINEFKKQIYKEELKIFFQDSLSQLALNQRPSEEFTKEKLDEIERKFVSFFKDTLKINPTKQSDEDGKMTWKISPSPMLEERVSLRLHQSELSVSPR